MSNAFKSKKTGGGAGSAGEKMMNKLIEIEQEKKESDLSAQQTKAQAGAAAARKRRDRRMGGQRSLLYATRLTGAPEAETRQSTLG